MFLKNNCKKLVFFVAIIFFIFGAITAPWEGHEKWVWRGLALYSLPLFCMFFQSTKTQTIGIIFGLTLGLQTLISPIFLKYYQNVDLVTLKPNMSQTFNIRKGVLPGLSGPQKNVTDRKGYRVTKTINYENKPTGHFRVFTIGGSTTEGFPSIGNWNNWPHLLQEKLNQNLSNFDEVEVINTGFGGAMARQHLATLKKVLDHSPDLVLFLVGINDWNKHIKVFWDSKEGVGRFIRSAVMGIDPRYSTTFINLREAFRFDHTIFAELIKIIKRKSRSNYGGNFCPENVPDCGVFDANFLASQMGGLNRTDRRTFRPEKVSSRYAYYLKKIGNICKLNKFDCLFITQPTAYRSDADKRIKERLWMVPWDRDYTLDFDSLIHIAELYNNYLIGFSKKNKFPYCDLAPQIKPSVDNFIDDAHFNLLGAKNVADLVSSCIVDFSKNS